MLKYVPLTADKPPISVEYCQTLQCCLQSRQEVHFLQKPLLAKIFFRTKKLLANDKVFGIKGITGQKFDHSQLPK